MRFLPITLVAAGLAAVPAQGQSPTPARAMPVDVSNGGFERTFRAERPWNGVDSRGNFASFTATADVLVESGNIGRMAMPVSVAVHDMNADGKADIVSSDSLGYLRIYFNEGTPTEPKFTGADIAPVFLTAPAEGTPANARVAPRVSVITRNSVPQLLFGNYFGEIFLLPNSGNSTQPNFRQPPDYSRLIIPTAKDPKRRWGNVFAPAMHDWNGDGKADLIIGEGSYSANNIHLALNEGTENSPRFSEAQRHEIAFGDGREQLTPAVVDYNGDGRMDLLVASRDGKVAVHLHPPEPWEPGMELPMSSFVSVGGATGKPMTLGGMITVAAGDLNGDGLFDLVFGRANGSIWFTLNEGTKQEPKFAAPKAFAGGTPSAPNLVPSGWDVSIGEDRGNVLGYATVVNAETDPAAAPVEGKSALKLGYMPNPNRVLPVPYVKYTGEGNFQLENVQADTFDAATMMREAPSNMFLVRQKTRARFRPGGKYTISFKVKGSGVTDAGAILSYRGFKQLGESRIERGERGRATVTRNEVSEEQSEEIRVTVGQNWSEMSKSFTVRFTERELADIPSTQWVNFDMVFALEPGKGVVYIDDVKLVENP